MNRREMLAGIMGSGVVAKKGDFLIPTEPPQKDDRMVTLHPDPEDPHKMVLELNWSMVNNPISKIILRGAIIACKDGVTHPGDLLEYHYCIFDGTQ